MVLISWINTEEYRIYSHCPTQENRNTVTIIGTAPGSMMVAKALSGPAPST